MGLRIHILASLTLSCTLSLWGQTPSHTQFILNLECSDILEIVKFRKEGGGSYPFKIVIGETITYKARKGAGSGWHWDLGDWDSGDFHPYWSGLTPNNPIPYGPEGTATLPGSLFNLPVSNNDLGSTHGLIRVTDGISTTYSENVLNLPSEEYAGPEKRVEIFFKKDDTTFIQTHPLYINPGSGMPIESHVPNWFYYWKQFVPPEFLDIPGIRLFDTNLCQFEESVTPSSLDLVYGHIDYSTYRYDYNYNDIPGARFTYGSNRFSAANNQSTNIGSGSFSCPSYPENTTVVTEYDAAFHHALIGKGCGFRKADPRDESHLTNILGLHTFLSTVIHEREHAVIECEVWVNGYSSVLDDDEDGYNDDWELMNSLIGFDPSDHTDKYNPAYRFRDGIYEEEISDNVWVPASAGTIYEETRCRNKEKEFLNTMQYLYDGMDWSYDPTNINQGKQYKD